MNTKEKSKWWKMYFWMLLIITFTNSTDINYSFLEISFHIVFLIWLLGLLAYIYQTPVFSQYFWMGIFVINLLSLSYGPYGVYSNWDKITENVDINLILWTYGMAFIFITPLLVALYSYTFNSSELWNAE